MLPWRRTRQSAEPIAHMHELGLLHTNDEVLGDWEKTTQILQTHIAKADYGSEALLRMMCIIASECGKRMRTMTELIGFVHVPPPRARRRGETSQEYWWHCVCYAAGRGYAYGHCIATIGEARLLLPLVSSHAWDNEGTLAESKILSDCIATCTTLKDVFALGECIRTFRGLMLLHIALGQDASGVVAKARAQFEREQATAEAMRKAVEMLG